MATKADIKAAQEDYPAYRVKRRAEIQAAWDAALAPKPKASPRSRAKPKKDQVEAKADSTSGAVPNTTSADEGATMTVTESTEPLEPVTTSYPPEPAKPLPPDGGEVE